MARSKADISNSAIRIFLQRIGEFYDKERDFDKVGHSKAQKEDLLEYLDGKCCYCGRKITVSTLSQDQLIPMNRMSLGLHAWGNVIPCCSNCNNERQQKNWQEFLSIKADGQVYQERKRKIQRFIKQLNYDPNLQLGEFAGNLYDDVGEVAMKLIELRLKQAEGAIRKLLDKI